MFPFSTIIMDTLGQVVQLLKKCGFRIDHTGFIEPPRDRNKFHQDLILTLYVNKAVDCINGQYRLPVSSPVPVAA